MEISATVRGRQHLMAGESGLAASMARASKNIGRDNSRRVCVMEISVCHVLGFFSPSIKNIQASQSVLEQYLEAFGIPQLRCMDSVRMDTVKSQEKPGVLDLRSQSEETQIKCLIRAKKACLKMNYSCHHSYEVRI